MKIAYRVKGNTNIGRWADNQYQNKGKIHCDMCGDKLWVNPGGGIYCNAEHTKEQIDNT